MVWLFGHFFNVDKNRIFWALCWTNLKKFQTFYEILHFDLVILTNLAFFHFSGFGLFGNCSWPNLTFFIFFDLATLLLMVPQVDKI